jgi:AAA15 family ATPase/GTPase
MKINNIVEKLKEEAKKSDMCHKHACVAIKKGRMITPIFHNYMRTYIFNFKCGSAHAEMATINYLLNSIWGKQLKKKQPCILRPNT